MMDVNRLARRIDNCSIPASHLTTGISVGGLLALK
jgi:hypothetical protein